MRHIRRPTALLILLLFCMVCATAEAHAAAASTVNSKEATRLYDAAAQDWRDLLKNEKRAAQRDPWLNLEKRFLNVVKQTPKSDIGAKAQYQAARCREELSKRSRLSSDWKHAANLYLALGKQFPKHNLADDGWHNAARIMAQQLKSPQDARVAAKTVVDKYPKGDMAPESRKLLASLQSSASKQTAPKLSATSQPAVKGPARINRIICRGTSTNATVSLEIDGTAAFRHQFLAATSTLPARLLIDVEKATLGPEVKASANISGMTVSKIRTALTQDKKSARVVIELRNVRQYAVSSGGNPPGIHVQCSASPDIAGGTATPQNGKNGLVARGQYPSSAKQDGKPGTLAEQLGLTVRTIMIDAGHGGKDPGAMGNSIRESEMTLRLARLLGERLRKQGFNVLYTRSKDSYVALEQRAVIANNQKADLFISLHVNANKDAKTNGLETYFLDLAKTSSAATVAARENAVSVKNISDLQFILTDLMLTSKLQESQDLAAIIHQNMYGRIRQAGFTVADNGVRSAPFYVLMGARMPAVLVEIGYLTNPDDARRIKNLKYLERMADGIALGVAAYKKKLNRFAGR